MMGFMEFMELFLTLPFMVVGYIVLIVAGILSCIAEKKLEKQRKRRRKKNTKVYYIDDYRDKKAQ